MKNLSFDARALFNSAERHRRGGQELQLTVPRFYHHVDPTLPLPEVFASSSVLLSLAAELLLHCQHVKRATGYKNNNHDLGQWYFRLPDDDKEAMQRNYVARLDFDFGTGWNRDSYREVFTEDLQKDLHKCGRLHNWARFVHEYSFEEVMLRSSAVGQVMEAIRKRVLEGNEDWSLYKPAPWMTAKPADENPNLASKTMPQFS